MDTLSPLACVNPADWVELHNPIKDTIVIGLWKFKDEKNNHT